MRQAGATRLIPKDARAGAGAGGDGAASARRQAQMTSDFSLEALENPVLG